MGRRKQIDKAYLHDLAQRLEIVPHSEKGALVDTATRVLGVSRNTLYSHLKSVGWSSGRKPRSDAGKCKVTFEEAQAVSGLLVGSSRATGKQLLCVADAMDIARANELIFTDASPSTMLRSLEEYGLHPKQLKQPSPHISMRSLHPNHVWQFDASVCVLYYLDNGGLAVMDKERFYKNKPNNFAKVSNDRVMRYVVTDHYSGAFYVRYFLRPGEDRETIFEFLVDAFTGRDHPQEPLRGVPEMLVWDAGSANQSQLVKGFLGLLGVKHWAHMPGNPRAKGQVEGAQDIIECGFEGRLFTMKVTDLDHLNEAARIWTRHYNAQKPHSRHGSSRYGLWQTISKEQLRLCPPREVCEQLLAEGIEDRRVRPNLMVSYALKGQRSRAYSVKHVPGVMVGDSVRVSVNPYRYPNIDVRFKDSDGKEVIYECVPEETDSAGFFVNAPVFGQAYKANPDTRADRNRKGLLKAAYNVDTQQEADKKRAKREPAFDGRIDPIGYLVPETATYFMNRPGTKLDMPGKCSVELRPLPLIEAMKRLVSMLGRPLTADENQRIRERYPDGITESAIEEVMVWLTGVSVTPGPSVLIAN